MPSTPPPTRLRTPPPPLHGAQHDTFEPYSPRRSTRSTAHRNPYSSKKSDHSPRKVHLDGATTPPPTTKRARFASFSTHLSSPPISPPSPDTHRTTARTLSTKTPKKALFTSERPQHPGALSEASASTSLATPASAISAMFPTPIKTPNKRQRTAINPTARILNFQPGHHRANDLMPTPRKLKKTSRTQTSGFELYDEDQELKGGDKIEIFTDTQDRIPTMDGAEENPFYGERASPPPAPKHGNKNRSRAQVQQDEELEDAVRNDEGVMYMFRGRKIFRRFTSADNEDDADTEVDSNSSQQILKHQAGSVAQRPLTRSSVKPRLLFPTEEQLRARAEAEEKEKVEAEEATTDVEMSEAEMVHFSGGTAKKEKVEMTPAKSKAGSGARGALATPPPTKTPKRATRSARKAAVNNDIGSPLPGKLPAVDEEEEEDGEADYEMQMSVGSAGSKGKKISPFAGWARTKAGSGSATTTGGKKRSATVIATDGPGAKRTRAAAVGSPA